MINEATKRSILPWIYIVFAIPVIGYIKVHLSKFPTTRQPLGLSSFRSCSFRDFGCGKAMSLDELFRKRSDEHILHA
jgi:hypothetical protein